MSRLIYSMLWSAGCVLLLLTLGEAAPYKCTPTSWDQIGPFYRPDPPLRNKIGSGYIIQGTVRSAVDCRPLSGARIEFWQVGPAGTYDDAHRAAIISDKKGRYRLETDFPPPYGQGKPHIHILVDRLGFAGLVTQHYPKQGSRKTVLDLVLAPE